MTETAVIEENLLPSNALHGVRVGISVSDSADLARLGLLETHFRLALGEIARCVLVSGGQLTYGGHLHPDGYTNFLVQELHRYNRRDQPFHIYLAWQEHRKLSVRELNEQKASLGLYGDVTCLDPGGNQIDPAQGRPEEAVEETEDDVRKRSLTALRGYMATNTEGRIFLGGKREEFQGDLPGLVEEALFALEAGQPIYLAGGFGGVTLDIIRALGVDDCAWFPPMPEAAVPDKRLTSGLDRLVDLRGQANWPGLRNGLSDDENRQLAATHRPSEIAALISLGLGRRFLPSADDRSANISGRNE